MKWLMTMLVLVGLVVGAEAATNHLWSWSAQDADSRIQNAIDILEDQVTPDGDIVVADDLTVTGDVAIVSEVLTVSDRPALVTTNGSTRLVVQSYELTFGIEGSTTTQTLGVACATDVLPVGFVLLADAALTNCYISSASSNQVLTVGPAGLSARLTVLGDPL